jgi:redox-sensitive bicupin YhaK (pirin superfamily)
MSWNETADPPGSSAKSTGSIDVVIDAQARAIDGIPVGRVLPSATRGLVGPFMFFDHFGPAELLPGAAVDVRPHPHINLATVTYLFEGEIVHRDSLGSDQTIRPGAVNWMTAGRGIVHSERTPQALRRGGSRLHGLQLWVALPKHVEEAEPTFRHYAAESLPNISHHGVKVRVLAGSAYGVTSPVETSSPLFYVDAFLPKGTRLELPQAHERAAYVVEGVVACDTERAGAGRMLVFTPGSAPTLRAESNVRVALIGGAPMDGPRHIWWNFASSSKERIELAKRDWREGRFPRVPGDEEEFIPLPDDSPSDATRTASSPPRING